VKLPLSPLITLASLLLAGAAMADFEAKEGTYLAVELKYIPRGKEMLTVRTSSSVELEMTLPLQISEDRIWPVSVLANLDKTVVTSFRVSIPEETPRLTTKEGKEHGSQVVVDRKSMLEVNIPAKLNDSLTVVETNTYQIVLRVRLL
jgi:hypothetical protein